MYATVHTTEYNYVGASVVFISMYKLCINRQFTLSTRKDLKWSSSVFFRSYLPSHRPYDSHLYFSTTIKSITVCVVAPRICQARVLLLVIKGTTISIPPPSFYFFYYFCKAMTN